MIDKQNIKESGLLEQYLLGQLNKEQENEITNIINSDDELKAYFMALESTFVQLGKENAIAPPAVLKEKLLNQLEDASSEPQKLTNRTISFKNYFAIAASIAAILLLGNIWFYTQLNSLKSDINVATEENSELNNNLEIITQELDSLNTWFATISNPNVEPYILEGNDLMPNAKAISYVNRTDKTVVINTQALPKLAADKDYQMWADVEGEMINMGIINTENELMAMTYIEKAESLNITIEPRGGSDHPTVSQLISNVYLK